MALAKISVAVVLTEINCGECAGTYAINERYREQQYEEGGTWNCPYCCCAWGYSGNEVARLRMKLEEAHARTEAECVRKMAALEEANQLRHKVAAQKSAATKLRNRAKYGVCPCCNRTFQQLAMHMQSKHPEYQAEEAA